ncbi:hypothetical protein KAT80_03080 [Candidatus Pacearchaeota archaeon]|nr:hypothetical protein [Candidatus Pacearchaeota archaeon]
MLLKNFYSEIDLGKACLLYYELAKYDDLILSLSSASQKVDWDVFEPHRNDIQALIEKVEKEGLGNAPVLEKVIHPIKKAYGIK